MKVLFIHQNFPGQFLHLSADLGRRPGCQVVALGMYDRPVPVGVTLRRYDMLRPPMPDTHPLLTDQESHVRYAEACAAAALQLQREGFVPDIIVAHPGWGEVLFIKDVFPRARLLVYAEYYYALEGQDVGFDPSQPPLGAAERWRLRLRNSTNLLSMELADAAISPTHWQRNTYPAWARDKTTVIHDGIDSAQLHFNPAASLAVKRPDGSVLTLRPGDEVISYVARNLEPVRGFHMLMRALPEVLRRRPGAQVVVVGGDGSGYGNRAPGGASWRQHMLNEVGEQLDLARVHFVGQLPYAQYLDLLSISRVHTYWTTPFVLSWSFLEAAVSGLPVIASATAPVLEFAGQLGVTTRDFFDTASFADSIVERCAVGARTVRQQRSLPAIELAHCLARQRHWLATA